MLHQRIELPKCLYDLDDVRELLLTRIVEELGDLFLQLVFESSLKRGFIQLDHMTGDASLPKLIRDEVPNQLIVLLKGHVRSC